MIYLTNMWRSREKSDIPAMAQVNLRLEHVDLGLKEKDETELKL